ncbi:ComEC/Rec2 family competence protein [Nitratireductor indicus]|uniref:ComEC/Rec2 family competence protein n=1 Tax=Nitratireductor indicus TaxID=721133 RepID=UPI002875E9E5|nr:hypothetical protein [Nitratireductor indicus]MDS1135990.1 hypothetical protein [Nitratireductor indicus]
MFSVKSIQAEYGDSLLVSYGNSPDALHHMLIDGGTKATLGYLLAVLEQHCTDGRLRLEALVITHFDRDHIDGIIELLRSPPLWLEVSDVWFNGHKHLVQNDVLGAREGDELTELIEDHYPWNAAFGGKAIKSDLPSTVLSGGLRVWVVSPNQPSLTKLATKWPEFEDEGNRLGDRLGADDTWPPGDFSMVASRPFKKDDSVANGSSIALMLEFNGKLVLLTGDAHPDVVVNGLAIHGLDPRPTVSLLKLSHHGSKGNTSEQLLKAIHCERFLISTNGDRFKHPDVAMLARILKIQANPTFVFNHAVERTLWWQDVPDGWPQFQSIYPIADEPFVQVDC